MSHVPCSVSGVKAGSGAVNSAIGPVMREPGAIDGGDVLGDGVDQGHVVTGAREVRAHGAADRARAPDQTARRCGYDAPPQEPASRARVSSTATCQSASMSSSDRW